MLSELTPRLLFAGSWRKSSSVRLEVSSLNYRKKVPFYAVSIDGVIVRDVKRALTVHVIYNRRLFNKSLAKLARRQHEYCDVADSIAVPALGVAACVQMA